MAYCDLCVHVLSILFILCVDMCVSEIKEKQQKEEEEIFFLPNRVNANNTKNNK